ncbi:putative thiamine biosynthetic bifunctional enzyme [Neolecta irregularis DAH-3]|uniref:Putative thiamine biosynthetic bifunctional enzyme n=1 Tax=Neolecta irregularis (strain DAH-3) TaxID=1198029 RepID=A0A1U7LPB8_NEOID|nr:putative thiamine biosynthetic bifunctional enzyme [Neolecta irregularis DAH-3]|eukprot:OLL24497.1 putative thiamine biosynthetic bifunctional enzyme [Neolecta irregularis DAH-3]
MVDYTLYLVASQSFLPPGVDLLTQIQYALEGGITVLQLREKEITTAAFVRLAKQVLALAKGYNVPLIINDRVDVMLAVDADGVHIGQDDMDAATVRQLIGSKKILGVSTNTVEEAQKAINNGADYIGIGAIFHTQTKALTVPPCGIAGCREIIKYCKLTQQSKIKTVAIGGINLSNIQRVKYQTAIQIPKDNIQFTLDGVAVVTAIISSADAKSDTKALKESWNRGICSRLDLNLCPRNLDTLKQRIGSIPENVLKTNPLIHHITNNVVKNFSANITLAVGASPIMSEERAEIDDLSRASGALLLNMGTLDTQRTETMLYAVKKSNENKVPIVFDPVGAGASNFRANATREFLESGIMNVIKGNEGELLTILKGKGAMKGVDSISCGTLEDKVHLVEEISLRERTVVVCTGRHDVISDGRCTVVCSNGHPVLGQVTGTGCALGSVIAACCAVEEDTFSATVAAVAWYGIAAELAAAECNGPGSFMPTFIDRLSQVQKSEVSLWMSKVDLEMIQ